MCTAHETSYGVCHKYSSNYTAKDDAVLLDILIDYSFTLLVNTVPVSMCILISFDSDVITKTDL